MTGHSGRIATWKLRPMGWGISTEAITAGAGRTAAWERWDANRQPVEDTPRRQDQVREWERTKQEGRD